MQVSSTTDFENLRYEVQYDPEVHRRLMIALLRHSRSRWICYYLAYVPFTAILCAFLLFTGSLIQTAEWMFIGAIAAAIGVVLPFVLIWEWLRKWIDSQVKSVEGRKATCTLSPEHWTYTNQDGFITSIPWKIMKLTLETPDAWLITASGQEIFVYRQPLREAGLEEEFRKRIGAEPQIG